MRERLAGVLLPVFSVRRDGDLGIGDTRGLIEWIDLLADHGVRLLQLLPLNETGADDSPYNAISSVALEPLYLAMEEVPGVAEGEIGVARGEAGAARRVDYARCRGAKRRLLELAWKRWPGAGEDLHAEFERFRMDQQAWLEKYCVYRWLMDRNGGTEDWTRWDEEERTPEGAASVLLRERMKDRAAVDQELERHAWIQWLCFRQWRAVRAHADRRGLRLMGDIPIGVSLCSADVFSGRDDFDLDWCGGAPPETMFKHDEFIRKWGQNWGIPLYRWERMEASGFPWWRQRIDKLTDVFHVFRIDHILGFYRIYGFPWRPSRNAEFLDLDATAAAERTGGPLPGWVPRPDDTPRNQALNRGDGDRRLRMILEAAGAAAVVGEDLGCVPAYVRPHLGALGIAGFRIPHWDGRDGHVVPGDELPECSFATYATHDHDPLPALWEDLRRTAAGDPDPDERESAARSLAWLCEFGGIGPAPAPAGSAAAGPEGVAGPYDPEAGWQLIDALMACRSRYAVVQLQELFGSSERINQPGTVGPQNWTWRVGESAARCAERPEWQRFAASIRRGGRAG